MTHTPSLLHLGSSNPQGTKYDRRGSPQLGPPSTRTTHSPLPQLKRHYESRPEQSHLRRCDPVLSRGTTHPSLPRTHGEERRGDVPVLGKLDRKRDLVGLVPLRLKPDVTSRAGPLPGLPLLPCPVDDSDGTVTGRGRPPTPGRPVPVQDSGDPHGGPCLYGRSVG